jgi:hypothetical protein
MLPKSQASFSVFSVEQCFEFISYSCLLFVIDFIVLNLIISRLHICLAHTPKAIDTFKVVRYRIVALIVIYYPVTVSQQIPKPYQLINSWADSSAMHSSPKG